MWRDAEIDDRVLDVSFSGPSFTLGGGVQYYLKETVSLELSGKVHVRRVHRHRRGERDRRWVRHRGDVDAFGLGVVWWP